MRFWMSMAQVRRRRWILAALVVLLAIPVARPVQAQSKVPAESLKLVPADAAFYSASLRGREQYEIIVNSKAWERIKSMPAVQMAMQMLDVQFGQEGGPLDIAKSLIELPENQELLALVIEMFSEETFIYGDQSVADFAELMIGAMNSARYAPLLDKIESDGDFDEKTLQARAMLDVLAEDSDKIRAPNFVWGFKIEDEKRAQTQIKRLEILAGLALKRNPDLKDRLKREDIGGASFLTFELDGSMIPWDEVPWDEIEAEEGEYADVREKLAEATLQIQLGVLNGYLMLSIGESGEHLEKLGAGDSLAGIEEFKPLWEAGDRRFTSIGYVSKEFFGSLAMTQEDVNELASLGEMYLDNAEDLPEGLEERLREDLDELSEDLEGIVPEVGALLQFSFLTDRGSESFTYNWGEQPYYDASKPLSMLDHLGGSPWLAAVSRGKSSPESYETLVKWIEKGYGYFKDFAVPEFDEDEREKFEQFEASVLELTGRLDETTREKLIPALGDGQIGIVFDDEWRSAKWHEAMPPSSKPLPMLEFGLLIGISDADLLVEAMSEYREIANDAIDVARKASEEAGEEFPEFRIPEPESDKTDQGTVFWYSLPAATGLDKQFLPTAGVTKDVAVIALSLDHANRLLDKHPLQAGGVLEDTKRPLASAVVFDWAALIDVVEAWVTYGSQVAADQDAGAGAQIGFVMQNVEIGLDVLRTLRTITSASYKEGDVMVTHTETHWRDLE